MHISEHTVVSIRYKMTNTRGEVLENTMAGPPIQYIQGRGNILPALEAELNGLKTGDPIVLHVTNIRRDVKGERRSPGIVQFTYQ